MGAGATLARLNRGDATDLVGIPPHAVTSVDMSYAGKAATVSGGIKISVENAARHCELQLGADAFANLQPGLSEPRRQLICAQSNEIAGFRFFHDSGLGWRNRLDRRRRSRGAAGDQQAGKGDKATHAPLVAAAGGAGKLAGSTLRR